MSKNGSDSHTNGNGHACSLCVAKSILLPGGLVESEEVRRWLEVTIKHGPEALPVVLDIVLEEHMLTKKNSHD